MTKKQKNKKSKPTAQKEWRNIIWYFLLALMLVSIITTYFGSPKGPTPMNFSAFMSELGKGNITDVTIRSSEHVIIGKNKSGAIFKTHFVDYPEFISEMRSQNVNIKVNPANSGW
ncbi:MAG: ATP-dependent Zn protease, partial [Candidatus Marinamargulisbacteria bacterium]